MKKLTGLILTLLLLMGTAGVAITNGEEAVTRVKDIARLQGVRYNQITGMGLVVGLSGTGDSSKVNAQMVANVLDKLGYTVSSASDLPTKNVAAVLLTANLPPNLHNGDKLDVQVASFGDAKSLQGGILLQSPLTGADGRIYAVAQGVLYIGGSKTGTRGAAQQKSISTVGIIPMGALIEREVPVQLDNNGKLRWALNNPDFTTAVRLTNTINTNIARGVAKAIDMGMVEVLIPRDRSADPVGFIAEIESLPVSPDGIAKVVINERTGTIVIGAQVKIAKVAVTRGDITVRVNAAQPTPQPAQLTTQASGLGEQTAGTGPASSGSPAPDSGGKSTAAEPKPVTGNGSLIELPEGTDIGMIVKALNSVGTTPQDIVAIIVAIKQAGALYGELEIM